MANVTFNETTLELLYDEMHCLSKILQFIDDQGDYYVRCMNEAEIDDVKDMFFQRAEALRIVYNTFIDYAAEED